MIDYAVQRANMIESQIRPNGITDARLIAAMATIPREAFVPEDRQALAIWTRICRSAGTASVAGGS